MGLVVGPATMVMDRPVRNVTDWVSAFPVGNGRLGAMDFGGVGESWILINESSIWAGPPFPETPSTAAAAVKRARELWFAGKYSEAQAAMGGAMAEPMEERSYQPAGWLVVRDGSVESRGGRGMELTQWKKLKGDSYVPVDVTKDEVPPATTDTYLIQFDLTAEDIEGLRTLELSPIDDKGRIVLNQQELGRTTSWDEPSTWDVRGKLKVGENELVMEVENIGGAGHPAKSVRLVPGAPEGYRRRLDMETGVVTTTWTGGTVRESFASQPDDVLVFGYRSGREEMDFGVDFEFPQNGDRYRFAGVKDGVRLYEGQAGYREGERLGTRSVVGVLSVADGSEMADKGDVKARSAYVLVTVKTDYDRKTPHTPRKGDLKAECVKTLRAAKSRGYDSLKKRATDDHRALFERCRLSLGGVERANIPLDQRLADYKAGAADPALEAQMFEYGRYLLIGSSRSGGLPANLQGIWNPHVQAPWNSDWHININLQMNYWPAAETGLAELEEPYFWLLERLRVDGGRRMAAALGCKGAAASHTTDIWNWSALNGQPVWGAWVMGLAWCSADMMEHYRFTQDKGFLKSKAWPVLRDSAEFLLDWLVEDPSTGKLVSGPTTSPENTFRVDGQSVSVGMGNAMDQEIAYEVFSNVIEAGAVVGADAAFLNRVKAARGKLAMPRVGADGRLMEWSKPFEEAEPGHRHMSHLYGMHPGAMITQETPELYAAARKSLEYRLSHGGGHTGWSRAWMINFWARLMDGEKAYGDVKALLQKSVIGALMDNHPPFQIDGNFGFTAGVAEMFVQSHEVSEGLPVVRLGAAWPAGWKTVEFTGLRTRAGVMVGFNGSDSGRMATLRAERDTKFVLLRGGQRVGEGERVAMKKGEVRQVSL